MSAHDLDLEAIAQRVWEPDRQVVDALARTEGDIVVLGAAGKMGVSLSRMAAAALERGGSSDRRVTAVSRFSDPVAKAELDECGVTTISADLMDDDTLASLPDAANVIYMAGRKFGTSADASATWAINGVLPALVASRYRESRIVAFSSGNVYPLLPLSAGGAVERTPLGPVGEYAQSCLARERALEHAAARFGTKVSIIRLNYAVDGRYGVLTDIARAILDGVPVDVRTPVVNVIWQGSANRYALASLPDADAPPFVLNVTGPETASVRWIAEELATRLGREVSFSGEEAGTALISNASRCFGRYGYPSESLVEMLDWTAAWIDQGGRLLGKPTHFAVRDGKF